MANGWQKGLHNDKDKIFELAMDAARELSTKASPIFNEFLSSIENDDSISILKIALSGLEANPQMYSNEIFNLLIVLHKKEGFNTNLKYFIRSLISKTYQYFSSSQKEQLNAAILTLKSKNEIGSWNQSGKTKFYSYYGQLKFEYLSSIPFSDLVQFPLLKNEFQELQRKFKKSENKREGVIRTFRVGAPLQDKAYEAMSLTDWENSFKKFDSSYESEFASEKGGLLEHHRAFEKRVKENPMFFLPLIEKIITENVVEYDYIIAGLNGLAEAQFSPETFFALYKKTIRLPHKDFITMQLVWRSDYLIKNQLIDDEILDFLIEVAINDPNPQKELNVSAPEHDTLNTNRGAAAYSIVACSYTNKFQDKIFTALKIISHDKIRSVKISALLNLAVLMNLDKQKTLELFLEFTDKSEDEHIYKASIYTAQYLAKFNFKALLQYFEKSVYIKNKDVQGPIATILAIGWLNKQEKSYDLLKKIWKESNVAKANMISVSLNNWFDNDSKVKAKCYKLFTKFLNDKSPEIIQEYSRLFLYLPPSNFKKYYQLISKYAGSTVAKHDPHYYFDYLIKCSKYHPQECIDLISHYNEYKAPDHISGPFYDGSEPIKIIVGAYNGLNETIPLNQKYSDKALQIFDKMLRLPIFRGAANQVLETI